MTRLACVLIAALWIASTSACEEAVVLGDGRSSADAARPEDASQDASRDASQDASQDASDPAPNVPRFAEPALIEALASAGEDADDDDPSLNAALTFIAFNSTREGGAGKEDLWFSRRASPSDAWQAPEPASELNTDARETGRALSDDGLTIYWSSDREGGAGALDIYTAERATLDDPWSEPIAVTALNSSGDDLISAVQDDGRVALFSRRDGDGDYHLFWSRRPTSADPWPTPAPIEELNTDDGATDAFLAREGTQLLFSREGDLYIAERAGAEAPFNAPAPLETLNGDDEDTDPWSAEDLSLVIFASTRSGESRLYEARREPAP